MSNKSLDKKFGLVKEEFVSFDVIEDAYVEGGDNADVALGTKNVIELKGKEADNGALHRIIYLKFDVSGIDAAKTNMIRITLACIKSAQQVFEAVPLTAYACDADAWSEETITYNNAPEGKEIIAKSQISGIGGVNFDVTEYVKKCVAEGKKIISLRIDEDVTAGDARRFIFSSKEGENPPKIIQNLSNINFTTDVVKVKINPWEYALERVETWLDRWEKIKARGDMDSKKVEIDDEEYPLLVDASEPGRTKGADTLYTPRKTRLVSTIKGYKPDPSEADLYDRYGGYTGGKKYEATGYFYTKKFGDRWQTVDPLGNPFYRVACVETWPGFSDLQKASVLEKFGTVENWAVEATKNLKAMGYNSTGGWSDVEYLSKIDESLALTKILYVATGYASEKKTNITTGGSVEIKGGMIPAFDPDFADFSDRQVKRMTEKFVDAPYIYGWMSDNELPCDLGMLDSCLSMDCNYEAFVYSYATAWTFMYLKTGKDNVSVFDITDELRDEFRAMVYDRYFELTKTAINKYDPNHQYMGCRFLPPCYTNEKVNRVAGYWCDVITINYYGAWTPNFELINNIQKWSGKPFAVTEWYAKGMDVWEKDPRMTNESGGGWTVRTQADRGKFYQNYALGLMEFGGCVGFDWFKYWDNDPDNLRDDLSNRNSNKGIYTSTHEEYSEVVDYMTELNNNKYSITKFFDERK